MIAVFDQVARFVRSARADIDREHRLDAGHPAPVDELVGAELVGLRRAPGQVEPHRPLLLRSDAVLPVVAGQEVAARIAHDRRPELARQRQHVAAKSVRVGRRMAGLVDAAVDAAAHVLDEGAEDPAVERRQDEVAIDDDARFQHGCVPVVRSGTVTARSSKQVIQQVVDPVLRRPPAPRRSACVPSMAGAISSPMMSCDGELALHAAPAAARRSRSAWRCPAGAAAPGTQRCRRSTGTPGRWPVRAQSKSLSARNFSSRNAALRCCGRCAPSTGITQAWPSTKDASRPRNSCGKGYDGVAAGQGAAGLARLGFEVADQPGADDVDTAVAVEEAVGRRRVVLVLAWSDPPA